MEGFIAKPSKHRKVLKRKKLVAIQRRREGVYNRTADDCVTFCEEEEQRIK